MEPAITSSAGTPDAAARWPGASRAKSAAAVLALSLGNMGRRMCARLIGGDDATLDAARAVLTPMGAVIRHVGPIGCGALTKLATNTLLGVQVTALAEVFGLFARFDSIEFRCARHHPK
ncbi:3-hydroxyisobutyrate dehydrogenase [Pandoraea capi]|uniref:3-hydroxyisobutyrate dehydrogenase n=1 Tax=Pandoraea capi TaxID=2508286 RepID=A0ABY6W1Z6_9BURK|nr:NAD(P)-dependent oxidoreductase [Pandoraea capi]VVE16248.1 3-hydroxyisobutyrate dehydrogenase [Pandoraea capi]